MAGWSLPFSERYYALQRTLRDLPGVIERTRAHIEQQQAYLEARTRELAEAEANLVRMIELCPDQIEALEAHHARIRTILREAGWNLPDPAPSTSGAVCPSCGHATSDHRPGFGCIEPLVADDGESWEGCPCDAGATDAEG